jgi:hypothetical protein
MTTKRRRAAPPSDPDKDPLTRGRPAEQDAEQRALGRIPASEAATIARRHISRLYRARDAGKLPMTKVGTYWYVAEADVRRVFPAGG